MVDLLVSFLLVSSLSSFNLEAKSADLALLPRLSALLLFIPLSADPLTPPAPALETPEAPEPRKALPTRLLITETAPPITPITAPTADFP